jgi:hypothetical protein
MTAFPFGAGAPLALASGVPAFAREYQRIVEALARCEPREATLEPGRYDGGAVARARRMWEGRALSEYQSSSVFSQLALQTMEANAPIDVTATVLRMAQDELRHADLCMQVVVALGQQAGPSPPATFAALPRDPGCSAEERALRSVIYGCCLSETVNAARFVDALDTVTDPLVRETTRRLLADESLHAQFGFLYLELWRPWLDARPAVREAMGGFLRRAFAVLERELAGAGPDFRAPTADEAALGVPTAESMRETFYSTIEQAIVPALDGFGLAASAAWRARALA